MAKRLEEIEAAFRDQRRTIEKRADEPETNQGSKGKKSPRQPQAAYISKLLGIFLNLSFAAMVIGAAFFSTGYLWILLLLFLSILAFCFYLRIFLWKRGKKKDKMRRLTVKSGRTRSKRED